MMYWYDHGMGGWGFLLMLLNMLVFWALVVVGIVLLARYLGGHRPHAARIGEAERILAERFARGEIDEEEFHRRREALRHAAPPPAGR